MKDAHVTALMRMRDLATGLKTILVFACAIAAFLAVDGFPGGEERFSFRGSEEEDEEAEEGHADEAFEWWYTQRALPDMQIPHDGLMNAYAYTKKVLSARMSLAKAAAGDTSRWEAIGPFNIGGRVLALAVDPVDSDVLWAGAASGGLWISTTGGRGVDGWTYIDAGFPLMSVSTIAINPENRYEIYVGTGEISGYNLGQVGTPGARTTYGLGILKSTDGGASWDTTGLNWTFSMNRSVQKVVINPKRSSTLYAATSEGTYRSYDAGRSWTRVHTVLMAMDVTINPVDTSEVYAACGQRNTAPDPGLYRSTNAGASWAKLTNGLPSANFGRTSLALSPSNPAVVYASVANAVSHGLDGLYKTTDHGATWTKMAAASAPGQMANYLGSQGWYDNIIAVHPSNPDIVLCAGIDIYKTTDGGATLVQKSYWYKDYGGIVPVGGDEGPPDYAHADHHAIVYDPKNISRVFFGTDGGVFESTNGGEQFAGRNGGFVTSQFYNGFANAASDSLIALGGTQDNGTIKYQGGVAWNKVYGGDGGWCAIDPVNKNIMYEEYVYLTISKTTDGGNNWFGIFNSTSDSSNFIAPFVLATSNRQVLYGGTKKIVKSTNGGGSWFATNGGAVLNGANVSCIAVSASSADTVIAATGQRTNPKFEIFASTNGGTTWVKSASAIPNRYPTDIAFDPSDSRIAYATFSGYGAAHVYRSTDAGLTWTNISSGFPDVPAQSVAVDPAAPAHLFVGTDLGVFRTTDGGASWMEFNEGMPTAMILDLGFSPLDRRLRAATFGNGAYQRKITLPGSAVVADGAAQRPLEFALEQNYPNPFNPSTTIGFRLPARTRVTIGVYDASGKLVATLLDRTLEPGSYAAEWNARNAASGVYFSRMLAGSFQQTRKMLLIR